MKPVDWTASWQRAGAEEKVRHSDREEGETQVAIKCKPGIRLGSALILISTLEEMRKSSNSVSHFPPRPPSLKRFDVRWDAVNPERVFTPFQYDAARLAVRASDWRTRGSGRPDAFVWSVSGSRCLGNDTTGGGHEKRQERL